MKTKKGRKVSRKYEELGPAPLETAVIPNIWAETIYDELEKAYLACEEERKKAKKVREEFGTFANITDFKLSF